MNEIRGEQELVGRLRELPREIAPARDAWPAIAARIAGAGTGAGRAGHRWPAWPTAAAAALLLAFAAAALLNSRHGSPGPAVPGAPSTVAAEAEAKRDFYAGSALAGALEYQAAMREFMVLNTVSPSGGEARPEWIEQGWGALRQVELELADALRAEPDNDFLQSRMAALRARQIELLKQIALVDEASWRNTI
jgi:hypothetical protein